MTDRKARARAAGFVGFTIRSGLRLDWHGLTPGAFGFGRREPGFGSCRHGRPAQLHSASSGQRARKAPIPATPAPSRPVPSHCSRSRASPARRWCAPPTSLLPQIATDFSVHGRRGLDHRDRLCHHARVDSARHWTDRRSSVGKFRTVAIACALLLADGARLRARPVAHRSRDCAAVFGPRRRPGSSRSAWPSSATSCRMSGASGVLGRYLTGQISGQLFGQAAGGIIGDLLGWRSVFFLLSAVFALAAIALIREYTTQCRARGRSNPRTSARAGSSPTTRRCCRIRGRASSSSPP